jgi:hypothetical protein
MDAAVVGNPAAQRPASVAPRVLVRRNRDLQGRVWGRTRGLDRRPWREAQRIDELDLNRGYISWRSPVGDSPFTETDRGSGWNLRSQVRGTGGTPQ